MAEVIVLCGYPSSGKTRFANYILCTRAKFLRICQDTIIRMVDKKPTRENKKLYELLEKTMIENALLSGYNVVIDGLNLTKKDRAKYIFKGVKTDCYIVSRTFEGALEANSKKDFLDDYGKPCRVSDKDMFKYKEIYQHPQLDEGFNAVFSVHWVDTHPFKMNNIGYSQRPEISEIAQAKNRIMSYRKIDKENV